MRYKTAVYNVMRKYEAARHESDLRVEEHKNEIYTKNPRIADIEKEINILGSKIAKLALNMDPTSTLNINDIRAKITQLKEEKQLLLTNLGMADISHVYNCAKCNDTGYIQLTAESPSTRCSCLKQKLIDEYYALSNIKEILQEENFDHFDFRLFSERLIENEGLSPLSNMQQVYSLTTQFVADFTTEFNNLLMYGGTGLGKTFACHCIAKDLLDKGHTVLYLTAPRLCKVIEDYRFNREALTEPDEMLETVDNVDLLILDDLGAEVSTIITSAALFDIINQRLISHKHTVISTNLTPTALESQYSERIVSRFFGSYQMIKFFGDDIRVKKKYGSLRM